MPSSPVQPIVNQQLANAAAALYTAPAGTWVQILSLKATNIDSGSHNITLAIVPNGSSYGTAFITTKALVLLAGNSYPGYNEYGLVLAPGDALYGFADTASDVNIFASGLLSTGA